MVRKYPEEGNGVLLIILKFNQTKPILSLTRNTPTIGLPISQESLRENDKKWVH